MADMRQIFTYPNNLATDYIDPDYVGDAFGGMTRRINHLLDGTYKTWLNPLVLTATTSEVMQNISKFGNFYENVSYAGHLSRYDFWNQPMVIATKKLIDSEDVTANVTAQLPMIVTTSTPHEFENGLRLSTSNIDGTWGAKINGGDYPEMYARVLSNTTLNIATDPGGSYLIGFVGGTQTYTLTNHALNYNSPMSWTGVYPNDSYVDTGDYNFVHIDLSQILVPYPNAIADGTAFTIIWAGGQGSGATGLPYYFDQEILGTYYLKNTPTSITDNIFQLYPTATLNQPLAGVNANPMKFVYADSQNRMIDFPLNQDINGVSRTVVTATINEEYPATITTSRPLEYYERWAWVNEADQVIWSGKGLQDPSTSGRCFGPLGLEDRYTGSETLEIDSKAIYLQPIYNRINTYKVRLNNAQPDSAWTPDWRRTNYTATNIEFGFYRAPQLYSPWTPQGAIDPIHKPWANANNARIKWDKSAASDNYVDGEPVDLLDPADQLQNDPYYLKEVISLSTSEYKVFDVYKNSGLTNLVTYHDYPTTPVGDTIRFYTFGSGPFIQFRSDYTGGVNNDNQYPYQVWSALRTTIRSVNAIPTYNIAAGEDLLLAYDFNTEVYTLQNKPVPAGTTPPAYIDAQVLGYNQFGQELSGSITGEDIPSSLSTGIVPIDPRINAELDITIVNTTTGQIGPYQDPANNPYEIDTVDLILPGNQTYHYRQANNQVAPGAQTNTSKYWEAGSSTPSYYTNGATSAQFSTTVDTDGYLQSVTLIEEPDAEGRYPTGDDIMVLIENKTDEYVPPAPTPAQIALAEDLFDTHDEWADNAPSNEKVWPDHVTPASASIVYNQPTIANMSQNGVKYTRSSGFTKWILEVEYPPMKAEDFQKFHAMAQAMAGQSKSIYFKLRNKDNVSILWADMMKPGSSESALNIPTVALDDYTPQGSLTLHLEGLTASDPEAFREGEVFIAGENENGSLHTAIGAAASNVFGETKVRMPYGIRSNMANSQKIFKNPDWAIVTLNSDAFEYSVDVNNYYTVSVAFDLDQWGS